jgi:Tol biopolymer transport system component
MFGRELKYLACAILLVITGVFYACDIGTDSGSTPENPEIRSITPSNGMVGAQVVIEGLHFSSNPNEDIVTFNGGAKADLLEASESQLVTTVPSGAQTGPIVVKVNGHTAQSTSSFTVIPPKQLAFVSDRSDNHDVWAVYTDGSNLTNLTNDPASDTEPKWSPDGSQIVFVSDRTGNNDIWVMNADGSNPTNLTNNPANDGSLPQWSPDGSHIAFVSDRTGENEIWVMEASGANPVNLTNDPANENFFPHWSPDGSKVAYVRRSSGNEPTWVVEADGGKAVNLTNDPRNNSFFPVG